MNPCQMELIKKGFNPVIKDISSRDILGFAKEGRAAEIIFKQRHIRVLNIRKVFLFFKNTGVEAVWVPR